MSGPRRDLQPHSETELAAVTVGAVEPLEKKVELVPPDPSWPRLFEVQAAQIRAALGAFALELHHVGSTAVVEEILRRATAARHGE